MTRRLAAIMFTDIAGYTALTQADEKRALRLLHDQERLLRPLLEKYRGRKVKSMGDGLLLSFSNALDAVEFAVEFQRRAHEHNAPKEATPIRVRIGIHLGDVQQEGTDILGDSVNIASRIEPLAEPGGICVSAQVFDQVHNKVPYRLESVGRRVLKGVRDPVEVYRAALPWEASEPTPEALPSRRIAILPLANISPDPSDEYLADGLTEELTSAMARVSGISVISRTSVLQYKERPKPVSEIGRELRCGTLIEGSVRKSGNRVRVAVQMIDADQDRHVWSESYDRDLQDVFGIQTDIAARVTEALKVELLLSEKTDIARKPTESVEAYQLYLRGMAEFYLATREAYAQALALFQQAVALDPHFAAAYAMMAECYHNNNHFQWLSPEESYPPMKELALKAIEIDPRSAEAHNALGAVYFHYDWNWGGAERELRRAIELKPSFGDCHSTLGYLLLILGRVDEARGALQRGAEINPQAYAVLARPGAIMVTGAVLLPGGSGENIAYLEGAVEREPSRANLHQSLGFAYYRASRHEEAIVQMRTGVALSPGDPFRRAGLAFILALCGFREEATSILGSLQRESMTRYISLVQLASIQSALGRRDDAVAALEEAYRRRAIDLVEVRLIPELTDLRADPRWRSIEARMGLTGS